MTKSGADKEVWGAELDPEETSLSVLLLLPALSVTRKGVYSQRMLGFEATGAVTKQA